jgi:hypothetical protein
LDFTEPMSGIRGASAQQVTIEKLLPLDNLEPGAYQLSVKVKDNIKNQVLTPTATFKIKP